MVRTPKGHQDRSYCVYLVDGLRDGFRIGFRYGKSECRSAASNMQSALEHPEVLSSAEVGKGRVLGPAPTDVCTSTGSAWYPRERLGSSGDSLWTCLSRKGPA